VLCAAIVGQPVMSSSGIAVESTIVVPQVDIATGNIDFDGAVTVKGDVCAGMSIRASGDVRVDGSVAAAAIDAGGNIVVKGGVIGGVDAADAEQAAPAQVLRCKGSFQARFVENAHVESATEILVDDYCMYSNLVAGVRIVVGRPGTKNGHIRGGSACATALVKAATLGSPAGSKTRVQVGLDPRERLRLARVEQTIEENEKKREDLRKLIAHRREHPTRDVGGVLEKAEETLTAVGDEISLLRDEATQLRAHLTLAEGACVVVERTVHGGTEIQIGRRRWTSTDDHANGVFRLHEGDITFTSA
jgi:uncharacterized protein (DUF342 family)